MISNATLKTSSLKQLVAMAKTRGVAGYRTMAREELLAALSLNGKRPADTARAAKPAKPASAKAAAAKGPAPKAPAAKASPPAKAIKGPAKAPPKKSKAPTKLAAVARATPKPNGAKVNGAKTNGTPAVAKATPPKAAATKAPAPKMPPAPARPAAPVAKAPVAKPPAPVAAKPAPAAAKPAPVAAKAGPPAVSPAKAARIARKINEAHERIQKRKDLSTASLTKVAGDRRGKAEKDRIVLMVRDAFWVHACWEVTHHAVQRAQAAMAEQWHTARPILRLIEVDAGATTSTAEKVARDIDVHGGVQNWYVEVPNPPKSYRAELGYLAAGGKFFAIARSNVVTTPSPGENDSIDENWAAVAQDADRIFAMSGGYSDEHAATDLQSLFEERLRRPMAAPGTNHASSAERLAARPQQFQFDVQAQLVIYGMTRPDAKVQFDKKPIKVREDGSFTELWAMPDKRQVIPITASTADGVEVRKVVIAVERNTKILEPLSHDNTDS